MLRRLSREDRILLIGIPVLVVLIVCGWLIWRSAADLDDIEARTLAIANVVTLTRQHLVIVIIATVAVMITAVPVGILLTRRNVTFLAGPVNFVANMGQAAPVIGVIVLLAIWLGFGTPVAILSLWIYAFLPVLANTVAGLRGVDSSLVEAAQGISMSPAQVLLRVELPMALPVIMVGARTALVLLVGSAAFATFISAGGLGNLITTGINLYRFPILVSGALLIAALALAVEWLGRVMEVVLTPKGMK
jgi:osmoprotectant transport system permease protein